MTEHCILFIEDDPSGRELGTFNLTQAGYHVDAASNGEEGLQRFAPEQHDLVVTDLRMPGTSGMDVLKAVKGRAPDIPVLVITAYGDLETAVTAMKAGAFDFIGKPFNRDHLLLSVDRALESRRLKQQVRTLRIRATGIQRPIVGESQALRRVLEVADRVAPTDANVLITGETGTGKELVARRIHELSRRAEGPFVTINCAAVPAELIDSELFGHEKGAFTGATRARTGRFRQADSGTIFLDEIAELPPPLQGKLLRVLQERVVDVVGRDEPVAVDTRVLAATNRDLEEQTRAGTFREDLLYRLNVVEVPIPPLRERPEDIEPLVRHFVAQYGEGRDLNIDAALLDEMRTRPWPGNVRQLQNACERLVILCPAAELRLDDLPPAAKDHQLQIRSKIDPAPSAEPSSGELDVHQWPELPEGGLSLVDLEKGVIERVLELKRGNVSQAAAYLGVPRHILAYRMAKYGIRRP